MSVRDLRAVPKYGADSKGRPYCCSFHEEGCLDGHCPNREAYEREKLAAQKPQIKAYKAWDQYSYEGGSTVVFAETPSKAKTIALSTDACEYAIYTDIRVQRLPQMDSHYRGHMEIDWYDPEDRRALVALGWSCIDTESWECERCSANDICERWQEDG